MRQIDASYAKALAYGFNAAVNGLLSDFGEYEACDRLLVLQAIEFFERERDKLNTGIDWEDDRNW